MKLFLAEKPSLGKAIAAGLPTPHKKGEGCIVVANGDVVSWCIGHLLEQAEPDDYDQNLKKWSLKHLPILPEKIDSGWKLKVKSKTRKQFTVVRKLIKQADHIVHCGDPDREGQLLVDEMLNHVGINKQVRENLERCLVNDLNLPAVKKSLNNLRPNSEFAALSISALARSRADWLYGMNLTRAYTLQAQSVGYQGVVSIGRVQTPVLGLVVKRDQEIEEFSPTEFYEVIAHIACKEDPEGHAINFAATWQPSEACAPYLDSDGRVLNKALAENVVSRIGNKPALVKTVEDKAKTQAPPLPYSLSALQIDAAKRFNMSAKSVLDICQNLYEQHKLITYPRSDNRYLPIEHWNQSKDVIGSIAKNSQLKTLCEGANTGLKSKAWNDKKVGAHHAIIPTNQTTKRGALSRAEEQVYSLIARQYLCQFYPAWKYNDQRIELLIEGGEFLSTNRVTTDYGWKIVLGAPKDNTKNMQSTALSKKLPKLETGQSLHCIKGELLEKMTQAPKHYSDATLLAAMTGIARYVSDPSIKKVLKDTDGLGTDATRANIIELLFKRGFLERSGKNILATDAGKGVINCLPECMTLPDMTAQWEMFLDDISLRKRNYQDFMVPLQVQVSDLIGQAVQSKPTELKGIKNNRTAYKKKRKARPSKGQNRRIQRA